MFVLGKVCVCSMFVDMSVIIKMFTHITYHFGSQTVCLISIDYSGHDVRQIAIMVTEGSVTSKLITTDRNKHLPSAHVIITELGRSPGACSGGSPGACAG